MDERNIYQPILVTIRCFTFNQVKYVRQCLEGFISQKTNFRFEAIVHDDASTDGTDEIIKEYERNYPDIITPILESENQWSKHDGSLRKIMESYTRGKYIAICEGDDYWTDPNKLQKQVDFLESHPDYSMCFHNAIEHYENINIEDKLFSNIKDQDYQAIDIYNQWIVPTASVVIRNEVFESHLYHTVFNEHDLLFTDTPLFLVCAKLGKIRGMSDAMSVYRKHDGGMTSSSFFYKKENLLKFVDYYIQLSEIFGKEYKPKAIEVYTRTYTNLFIYSRKNGHTEWQFLFSSLIKHPFQTIICLWDSYRGRHTN